MGNGFYKKYARSFFGLKPPPPGHDRKGYPEKGYAGSHMGRSAMKQVYPFSVTKKFSLCQKKDIPDGTDRLTVKI